MRLAYDPFRDPGQWTPAGFTGRSATRIFGAADNPFSIEATRRIARQTVGPEPVGAYGDMVSMGSATLRYRALASVDDGLSLGLTAGMEKRRFALDLADGRRARNESIGFDVAWSHGRDWRLGAGYRVDFGSRPSTTVERGIELADRAALSQRGVWTALSYEVGRQGHSGGPTVDLRAQSFLPDRAGPSRDRNIGAHRQSPVARSVDEIPRVTALESRRRLLASIHDVSPRFSDRVDRLADRLVRHLGAPRFAMLVVPDHWSEAPIARDRAFQARLRAWHDAGIEMFVHGWFHRDEVLHRRGAAGFKARHMTAGEGEFLGLNHFDRLWADYQGLAYAYRAAA